MAWSRDSLTTIEQRVRAALELRVRDEHGKAVDANTPGTGWTELAEAMAGVSYEMQGRQQWIADQILLATADEATLVARAIELGIPRIAPDFAAGPVIVTGDDGQVIPNEKVLQHSGGVQVRTTAEATIAGGTATIPVVAMVPGTAGNLAAGQTLSFVSPISGVDSDATVDAGGLTGGADIESVERLRERLLERRRQPPMGGKDYDYVAWAKAAHVDVTRVFPFFHENGIGSIVVRFVTEDLADPIPTAAHITAVTDYLETKKPAGTRAFAVEAPAAAPLDLVFTSLTPNTPAVQAAIEAEVQDLIRREGKCDGTLLLSHIREAISNAAGEEDFDITLDSDFETSASEFPTLGNTTWPS